MPKRERPLTEKEAAYQKRRQDQAKRDFDAWIAKQMANAPPLTQERLNRITRLLRVDKPQRRQTSTKPPEVDQP